MAFNEEHGKDLQAKTPWLKVFLCYSFRICYSNKINQSTNNHVKKQPTNHPEIKRTNNPTNLLKKKKKKSNL